MMGKLWRWSRNVADSESHKRKKRTRQHVIADLGVNFVERIILLAGHTADRFTHDYGIDLTMNTFSETGEVESGSINIQVKSTEHLRPHSNEKTFPIRIDTHDIRAWLMEWDPVILMVYDAVAERAYWLHVQEYAKQNSLDENLGGRTVTLKLPLANLLTTEAVQHMRRVKEELSRSRRGS